MSFLYSTTTIEKVGIFFISVLILKVSRAVLKFTYQNVLAPSLNMNVNFKKSGKWAVVTGATDGLGKAYAEQLANKGLSVVLISRTKSKLEETAKTINEKYGVETKIVEADFTDDGSEMYAHISKELFGMDIGVLVNNVGLSYPNPEYFLNIETSDPMFDNIVKCNIVSALNMCRIVMPGMVERRRGVVINISSTAAQIPCPLLTVYGASKKFVQKLSEELNTEYKSSGITVQCVIPGYVATKMSKISKPTWMAPTPEKFVKSALQTTGIECVTTGYLPHTLMVNFINIVNMVSQSFIASIIMKNMLNIRARALRKANLK
ncbi:very-long-chain 3-oxoacyl-CoA reductase-like [Daktulosphaira vitifoliae]|uniref:very-long-chain 3-oxoacyl-CoA reductase-like n=1 Tax=Daktulosphaira vitifoliae TaxID=58002 RepID=UPI0021A9FD8B|nr:very-long-chain 3-oxoacyl-CoA reductase-like [Daktulosphaira vitifoliae]